VVQINSNLDFYFKVVVGINSNSDFYFKVVVQINFHVLNKNIGENATQEENISNPFQKDTVEEKRRRIKQISKKRTRKP
jgi:hypothetical protein